MLINTSNWIAIPTFALCVSILLLMSLFNFEFKLSYLNSEGLCGFGYLDTCTGNAAHRFTSDDDVIYNVAPKVDCYHWHNQWWCHKKSCCILMATDITLQSGEWWWQNKVVRYRRWHYQSDMDIMPAMAAGVTVLILIFKRSV